MKILLTATTGGIGSAIKKMLENSGHELTIVNHADVDLASSEEIFALARSLKDRTFDWFIFAHGLIDEKNIESTFKVNTLSNIYLTESLFKTLALHGGVIFTSSTAGITGNGKYPVYAASKGAVNIYVKSMARAFPSYYFFSVCPGPTETQMLRDLKLDIKGQSADVVARAVKAIMNGMYQSGDIITVKNGQFYA